MFNARLFGRLVSCACVFGFALSGSAFGASYEGFTEPYLISELKLAERGVVAAIHVAEGSAVSKGTLLVELDNRVLQSALKIAEAKKNATGSLAAAKARRSLTENQLNRLVALEAQGHAQFDELAKARADAAVAKAEVRIANDELRIQKLEYERLVQQIENRKLQAPFEGVVVRVYPAVGETVHFETEPLARLVQLEKLRIVLHLRAPDIAKLEIGSQVSPKCLAAHTGSESTVSTVVEHISPVIDPDSGTIRVKLLLDNSDKNFRSGVKCALEL